MRMLSPTGIKLSMRTDNGNDFVFARALNGRKTFLLLFWSLKKAGLRELTANSPGSGHSLSDALALALGHDDTHCWPHQSFACAT